MFLGALVLLAAGVPAHMSRIVDPAVLRTVNGLVQTLISLGAFAGPVLSAALLATGSEAAMDIASAALVRNSPRPATQTALRA